jgi:hypothetical protein
MKVVADNLGVVSSKRTYMEAVVFPACECGESWTKHGSCGGYKPSRPAHFISNDWLANTLFAVERFFYRLRIARVRSK